MKYDVTRIPEITSASFQIQSDETDPNIIKSRDELENELKYWYVYFMDTIQQPGGNISVAELRRRCNLDVQIEDYFFGFDKSCLSYTGMHGIDIVKFNPIHLKQILEPNLDIIDIYSLGNSEENKDIIKMYSQMSPAQSGISEIDFTRIRNLASNYNFTMKDDHE